MILIGDTHGKTERLVKIIEACPENEQVYQLGDMGLGFIGVRLPVQKPNFKFIRGNHDDPAQCREHPNYLGDYGYIPEQKLFYVSGAWSIDWQMRTPSISWWYDEQLSTEELNAAYELYAASKPEIVISHECPHEAGKVLLAGMAGDYFAAKGQCFESVTSRALQRMFEAHQPKSWTFGHYHVTKDFELRGTTFRCLAELIKYNLTN